jgi:hypothetical protein
MVISNKRTALLTVSALAVCSLVVSFANATGAVEPSATPRAHVSISASAKTEELLDSFAERVYALPDKTGFAGAEVDTPHRTLIVRWKGEVPSELTDLKSVATEAGLTLVAKPAVYSEADIMTAGRLLRSTFKEQAWRPTLIHGTPSRDGLVVGVSSSALELKSIQELKTVFEKLTHMPVNVEVADIVGAVLKH